MQIRAAQLFILYFITFVSTAMGMYLQKRIIINDFITLEGTSSAGRRNGKTIIVMHNTRTDTYKGNTYSNHSGHAEMLSPEEAKDYFQKLDALRKTDDTRSYTRDEQGNEKKRRIECPKATEPEV